MKLQFRERRERGEGREETERERRGEAVRESGQQGEREREVFFKNTYITHFLATTVEYGVSFLSPSM